MSNINMICTVDSCTGIRTRRLLCEKHYKREWTARKRQQGPEFDEARRAYANSYRINMKEQDPECYLNSVRERNLRINYNVSVEWFESTMITQDHRCAICKRHESEFSKRFAVDHDHNCCQGNKSCGECVRGLLCVSCNNGLGRFSDDPERIESAAEYLRSNRMVNKS